MSVKDRSFDVPPAHIETKLTVLCSHEQKRQLRILAASEGTDMSALLRRWIAGGWAAHTNQILKDTQA